MLSTLENTVSESTLSFTLTLKDAGIVVGLNTSIEELDLCGSYRFYTLNRSSSKGMLHKRYNGKKIWSIRFQKARFRNRFR
jgi:hypothetical protein